MNEPDLPEPKPVKYTLEQTQQRTWNLVTTLLLLSLFYSVLHKLVVPIILKFSPLTTSDYSIIDFWFIHPIILWLYLNKYEKLGDVGSFLAGIGIVYGVYEVYELISGQLTGWLAFSRLLASLPVAFCCGLLMTLSYRQRSFKWAWAGSLGAGTVFIFLQLLPAAPVSVTGTHTKVTAPSTSSVDNLSECGAAVVTPNARSLEFVRQNQWGNTVQIQECGFGPSLIPVSGNQIKIMNNSAQGMNVHLMYFDGTKRKTGWNLMVAAGKSLERPVKLRANRIGVIYSDSAPQAGLIVLVPPDFKGNWKVSRNPLRVIEP